MAPNPAGRALDFRSSAVPDRGSHTLRGKNGTVVVPVGAWSSSSCPFRASFITSTPFPSKGREEDSLHDGVSLLKGDRAFSAVARSTPARNVACMQHSIRLAGRKLACSAFWVEWALLKNV